MLPEILDHKDSATAMNVYAEATKDEKVNSFESLQGKWRFFWKYYRKIGREEVSA